MLNSQQTCGLVRKSLLIIEFWRIESTRGRFYLGIPIGATCHLVFQHFVFWSLTLYILIKIEINWYNTTIHKITLIQLFSYLNITISIVHSFFNISYNSIKEYFDNYWILFLYQAKLTFVIFFYIYRILDNDYLGSIKFISLFITRNYQMERWASFVKICKFSRDYFHENCHRTTNREPGSILD